MEIADAFDEKSPWQPSPPAPSPSTSPPPSRRRKLQAPGPSKPQPGPNRLTNLMETPNPNNPPRPPRRRKIQAPEPSKPQPGPNHLTALTSLPNPNNPPRPPRRRQTPAPEPSQTPPRTQPVHQNSSHSKIPTSHLYQKPQSGQPRDPRRRGRQRLWLLQRLPSFRTRSPTTTTIRLRGGEDERREDVGGRRGLRRGD